MKLKLLTDSKNIKGWTDWVLSFGKDDKITDELFNIMLTNNEGKIKIIK